MTLTAALTGALVISFSAIFFSLSGAAPMTGAFYRMAYSLPILFALWFARRDRDGRTRRKRLIAFGAGLALGFDIAMWHTAINYIGTGLATLLVGSQAIFVAVFAWLFLGEIPSKRVIAAVPLVLVGVGLVSGAGQGDAFGDDPLLATGLALAAALFYAIFILGYRASNDAKAPAAGPLMEVTAGAMVASLLVGSLGSGIKFAPAWPEHGWLLALALGVQVLAWLLIGYALPRLPAAETATIILVQPVGTMLWGALIFSERPSLVQMIGAALVLVGVGLVATALARRAPTPAPA